MKHRLAQRLENLEAARREKRMQEAPVVCIDTSEKIAEYRDRWKCDPIFMIDEGDEQI